MSKSSFSKLAATTYKITRQIWALQDAKGRRELALGFTLLVLGRLAPLGIAILFGWTVDHMGLANPILGVIVGLLAARAAVEIFANAFDRFSNFLMIQTGLRAVTDIEVKIYEHVLRLPMSFFRDALKGGVSKAFDRGTIGVMLIGVNTMRLLAPIIFELLAAFILMAWVFGPLVSMLAVGSFVAYVWGSNRLNHLLYSTHELMVDEDEGIAERVVESLTMGETIKALAAVSNETSGFRKQNEKLRDAKINLEALNQRLGWITPSVRTLITLVLSLLVGWQVVQGQVSAGEFVSFVTILGNLFRPLENLLHHYQANLTLERDSAKFLSFLDLEQEADPGGADLPLREDAPCLSLNHIGFAHPDRDQLFDDLSLQISRGEQVAFAGRSGSGKSTLGMLLTRLEQGYEGQIDLMGVPTQNLPLRQLRSVIALTPQFTHLRAGTITQNLQLGSPNATQTELESAAKAACFHDFVMSLPDGYATKVGEGGQKLSGGERQRLALARSLLREAEVYIFDEATSALDLTTEAQVMANIRARLAGKTLIFIAHRLTTIQHVDQIFVLDQGKLVEQGSHKELRALKGAYDQLWRTQDV